LDGGDSEAIKGLHFGHRQGNSRKGEGEEIKCGVILCCKTYEKEINT